MHVRTRRNQLDGVRFLVLQYETGRNDVDGGIVIYDAMGRIVDAVFEGSLPPGNHNFTLSPMKLTRGTYFVVVESEGIRRSLTWMIK